MLRPMSRDKKIDKQVMNKKTYTGMLSFKIVAGLFFKKDVDIIARKVKKTSAIN